jgi:hypothetical protein
MNNNSIKTKLREIDEILFEIKTNKQNIINVLKEKQVIDINDNPKLSEIPEIIKNIIICNHFGLLRVNSNLDHEGKWSIDGGLTWHDFNYEIKVEIGTYEIIFNELTGYKTPEHQTVTIETGILTEITANYIQYGGLIVNSNNAPEGAQWRLENDQTWYNFGTPLTLIPGTYNIIFKDVSGYITPASQQATITAGETTSINAGIYEVAPTQIGYLIVLVDENNPGIYPPEGARWSIDGGTTWNIFVSNEEVELNAGTYTVIFNDITGYITPNAQTVVITAGQTTFVSSGQWIATSSGEEPEGNYIYTIMNGGVEGVNGNYYNAGETWTGVVPTYTNGDYFMYQYDVVMKAITDNSGLILYYSYGDFTDNWTANYNNIGDADQTPPIVKEYGTSVPYITVSGAPYEQLNGVYKLTNGTVDNNESTKFSKDNNVDIFIDCNVVSNNTYMACIFDNSSSGIFPSYELYQSSLMNSITEIDNAIWNPGAVANPNPAPNMKATYNSGSSDGEPGGESDSNDYKYIIANCPITEANGNYYHYTSDLNGNSFYSNGSYYLFYRSSSSSCLIADAPNFGANAIDSKLGSDLIGTYTNGSVVTTYSGSPNSSNT